MTRSLVIAVAVPLSDAEDAEELATKLTDTLPVDRDGVVSSYGVTTAPRSTKNLAKAAVASVTANEETT